MSRQTTTQTQLQLLQQQLSNNIIIYIFDIDRLPYNVQTIQNYITYKQQINNNNDIAINIEYQQVINQYNTIKQQCSSVLLDELYTFLIKYMNSNNNSQQQQPFIYCYNVCILSNNIHYTRHSITH